jgi:hypothetical protein
VELNHVFIHEFIGKNGGRFEKKPCCTGHGGLQTGNSSQAACAGEKLSAESFGIMTGKCGKNTDRGLAVLIVESAPRSAKNSSLLIKPVAGQ